MNSLVMLLIAHVIGDFYFQTRKVADEKYSRIGYLILHCFIYAVVCFVLLLLTVNLPEAAVYALIIGGSHFLIDLGKVMLMQKGIGEKKLFTLDQAVHVLVILAVAYYIDVYSQSESIFSFGAYYSLSTAAVVVLIVLFAGKPSNIIIRVFLSGYKPDDTSDGKPGAGGAIGILERLIMIVFLFLGQYAAIGLVLTAKSIARYNKISEDKQFAEYYLLGTLLSLFLVLVPFVLFRAAMWIE